MNIRLFIAGLTMVVLATPQNAFARGERRDAAGVRHSASSREERMALIAPVGPDELRVRPTFVSCGVCFGSVLPGLELSYRRSGEETWTAVPEFPAFPETGDSRGSIMDLDEDTAYEVRVCQEGAVLASSGFRTWKSDVPVARTVVLDPKTSSFPIVISSRGTDDGWIRYTIAPGAVLSNSTKVVTLVVDGASNVLIDDIVFWGGLGRNVLQIRNSARVRIRNCQFSHWGRPGRPRYEALGRPFELDAAGGQIVRNAHGGFSYSGAGAINFDGAVRIERGARETVVERCWFHDPRTHSNSWYYSHPSGNNAISAASPDHSTVVRWCDFTGSDEHRWNDAVESAGNFDEDGGFNRDADIYGNFMIFSADDSIELDGGQQNVRLFDNRFESSFCGISIQGNMAGPSYVWRNGVYGLADEFGLSGQTVKTGNGPHGEDAYTSVFGNLFWGPGTGITFMELLRANVRGNTFCGNQGIRKADCSPRSTVGDNRLGAAVPESELPVCIPRRPAPFVLDRARIGGIRLAKGVLSMQTVAVSVSNLTARAVPFGVKVNDDQPWLAVSPADGVLAPNGVRTLTVAFDPAKMRRRRDCRGAFLVRSTNGLSRACSVYVQTDTLPVRHPARPGEIALYRSLRSDGAAVRFGPDAGQTNVCVFTVPRDGRYYFFLHARTPARGTKDVWVSLDGAGSRPSTMHALRPYFAWLPCEPGNRFGNTLGFHDFKAGETHEVRLSDGNGTVFADEFVVTDAPGSFEPFAVDSDDQDNDWGDGRDAQMNK